MLLFNTFIFKQLYLFRYVLLNATLVYTYSIVFQKIDEDEFGGVWEIIKEGFMTSFSTFLVYDFL